MYNSQYYTCEQIDERLLQGYLDDYNTQTGQSLTKAQFLTKLGSIFSKEGVIDNTATQIGYYECDTAAGTAAKAITVANYALFAGGSMKVKFANKNTANNATLNINSQGAKALYYQGERASATNSWDAEEVVEIYYDGTSYYANNVKGGSGSGVYDVSKEHPTSGPNSDGKFTLEYILNSSNVNELIPVNKRYHGMSIQFVSTSDNKYVQYRLMSDTFSTTESDWQGIDDEPTAGSENLVESGGVFDSLENVQVRKRVVVSNLGQDIYAKTKNFGKSIYLTFISSSATITSGNLYYRYTANGVTLVHSLHIGNTAHITSEYDIEYLRVNIDNNDVSIAGDVTIEISYGDSANLRDIENLIDSPFVTSDKVNDSITQSNKCFSVKSEKNIVYESGSNNIYITSFHYYTRGGVNISLNNITDLKNRIGGTFTPSPSGVDSVLVPDRYKLVLRGTNLSIVSYDDIDISERLLIAVISGKIVGGEFEKIISSDIENSAITEEKIADKSITDTKISQDLYKETIGLFTNVFVAPATQNTYITYFYNVPFINGHRYKLTIKNPVGYSGQTYFSVRGYNGSTSIYQNDLLRGSGDREGEFTCNIDGGLSWCLTVVDAHESELSFECTMLDLDIDSIGYNSKVIKNIIGDTDIIQLNGKAYLDNIMAQSKRAAKEGSGGMIVTEEPQLVLLHFSDIHGDAVNTSRIIDFYHHYSNKIDDILCTGDIIADKWEDDITWWNNVGAGNILVTIGNHDVQTSGTAITSKQAYDRYIAPYVSQWGVTQPIDAATNGYNYYYKDYSSAKIRLICLDCMFWNDAQNDWLAGVLEDARSNNLAVICAQHFPFEALTGYDTPFNSLMPSVFNGWWSKALNTVKQFVTVDGGEFICWLVGHVHVDYFGIQNSYPEQPIIAIANGGLNDYWNDTARVEGEKSQDCFNIISFDYHQKIIKIARVGADYDRLLRHKGTLCYKYDTRQLVTT